ncbi:hypothetical protein [Massilia sp. TSP1-1-2]|uniref:hypothetical protein n=1 Tax=unclassified Massilia TaxID=2609279 RepID=UPI003CEBF2D8
MMKKKMSPTPRRSRRPTVTLEIELPELSDEAAAAVADVLVQLYHRFEATYYAQILNHHADRVCMVSVNGVDDKKREDEPDLF